MNALCTPYECLTNAVQISVRRSYDRRKGPYVFLRHMYDLRRNVAILEWS